MGNPQINHLPDGRYEAFSEPGRVWSLGVFDTYVEALNAIDNNEADFLEWVTRK